MQSTAAKLSALIAVTDWGYGAGYARAWPYRYGTYGVGSGAPSTYTEASNYTEGTMILDLLDTRTNKLVFRGTGHGGHRRTGKQRGQDSRCSEEEGRRPSQRCDARSSAS
jgi:hypothetical protein